ncbi:Phosphate transport system regulatory protein PhoU [Candidatus Hepatincolaceae symbiont of Richtersius coronifer]
MANQHIVKSFEEELVALRKMLIEMNDATAKQLDRVHNAISKPLDKQDPKLIQNIIQGDGSINNYDQQVINLSLSIFRLRNPVAYDLRFVFSATHISRNLERIGDNTKNIAKQINNLEKVDEAIQSKLLQMIHISTEMMNILLHSLSIREMNCTEEIIKKDESIDDLYIQITNLSLQKMKTSPAEINSLHSYLLMSRYLERIGDHAVNVARYINFAETSVFLYR